MIKKKDVTTLELDVETSGKDFFMDQNVSISGKIHKNGEEIDYFDESCRRDEWKVPSPEALLINNFCLDKLSQETNSSRQLLERFFNFVEKNQPDLVLGHNLSFDINFIACQSYQHLICPDAYYLKIGRVAACTLAMSRASHALHGSLGINIELSEEGFPQFDLTSLCRANGLPTPDHSSAQDIRASEKLGDLIEEVNPDIFRLGVECGNKRRSQQLVKRDAYFISAYGSRENFAALPLTPLAYSEKLSSFLCLDLTKNLKEFETLKPREIAEMMMGPEFSKLPFKRFKVNKGFVVADQNIYHGCLKTDLTQQELFRKASEARRSPYLNEQAKQILKWVSALYEEDSPRLEKSIFQSFLSSEEKSFIKALNLLPRTEDKWATIEKLEGKLPCNRLARLGRRMVLQNFPEHAPCLQRRKFEEWCQRRVSSTSSESWQTLYSAFSKLILLRQQHPEKSSRLDAIEKYYRELAKQYGVSLPLKYPEV